MYSDKAIKVLLYTVMTGWAPALHAHKLNPLLQLYFIHLFSCTSVHELYHHPLNTRL